MLALVILAVFVIIAVQQPSLAPATAAKVPPNAAADGDGIVVNPGRAGSGAPVVALYFDYQCRGCLAFEQSFGGVLTLLGETGEIQLEHRTRTFLDQGDADGLSHRSAMGASCADLSGQYAAYHEALFAAAEQGPYTDTLFRETIPAKIGLAGTALAGFQECFDTRATKGWVKQVDEAAGRLAINTIPALTVNGKVVPLESLTGSSGDDLADLIADAAD